MPAAAAAPAAPPTPPITNMIVMLGMMYLGGTITIDGEEFADRRILLYAAAVLVNLAQLAYLGYAYMQIQNNADKTIVKVPPQKMMGQDVGETKTMTTQEYDKSKVMEALNQLLIGACIVGFITYKWESHRPLMLNTMFAVNTALDAPLFKVYILGKPTVGALKRPWTPPSMNPLGNMMGQQPAAPAEEEEEPTPAAEIEDKKAKKSDNSNKKKSGKSSRTPTTPKEPVVEEKSEEESDDVVVVASDVSEEDEEVNQSSATAATSTSEQHHHHQEKAEEEESTPSAAAAEQTPSAEQEEENASTPTTEKKMMARKRTGKSSRAE